MSRESVLRKVITATLTPTGGSSGLPVPPLLEIVLAYAMPIPVVRTLIAGKYKVTPSHVKPVLGRNFDIKSPDSIALWTDKSSGERYLLIVGTNCTNIDAVSLSSGDTKSFVGNRMKRGAGDGVAGFSFCEAPRGMCVNPTDNSVLFVDKHRIRQVKGGVCSTIAGSDVKGYSESVISGLDATFSFPVGICCSSDGRHVFVSDNWNHVLRQLTLSRFGAASSVVTVGGDGGDDSGSNPNSNSLPYPDVISLGTSPNSSAGVSTESRLYVRSRGSIRVLDLDRRSLSTLELTKVDSRFFVGAFVFVSRYLLAVSDLTTDSVYLTDSRNGESELLCGPGPVSTAAMHYRWRDGPYGPGAHSADGVADGVAFSVMNSMVVGRAPAPPSADESAVGYAESGVVLYVSEYNNGSVRTIDLPPKLTPLPRHLTH